VTEETPAKQKKKTKKTPTQDPRQEAIRIEQHRKEWEQFEDHFMTVGTGQGIRTQMLELHMK
jgi:hypothetical protein